MTDPFNDTITTWLLSAEQCTTHEREEICDAVQSYRDYMDRLQRLLDQLADNSSNRQAQTPP